MNMNFTRGLNPKDAMNLGIVGKVKEWFDKHNTAKSNHTVIKNGNIITVHVKGSLVLERFNPDEIEGVKGNFRVEIGEVSGTYIILNLLALQQIYEKIKSFYIRVLDNCLGKSTDEQYEYLIGEISETIEAGQVKVLRGLKDGEIANSEELIKGLPEVPTNQQLLDVANEIISGKLEYAFHVKDEFSVKMNLYATEILKRLMNS